MGNCQATDAAAVVIQHPGGRVERLYWPIPASEVMRNNPGHYVALISLCRLPDEAQQQQQPGQPQGAGGGSEGVRFTRVRLLRPKDTLVIGQVYRLVTSQGTIFPPARFLFLLCPPLALGVFCFLESVRNR